MKILFKLIVTFCLFTNISNADLIKPNSNLEPFDVYNADEAFMTGTPFCLLPITTLNGLKIGDGKVGKIYSKLLKAWGRETKVDIKKQIQNWNRQSEKNPKSTGTSPYKFK